MVDRALETQLPGKASPTGTRERSRETPRETDGAQGVTCRMFENDLLEKFSRIHPAMIFVVWVPVVIVFLARSALRHDLAPLAIVATVLSGTFAWTLAEYALHRYVFHWTKETPWGKRVHFLLHGVHHEYPGDKDRLVMPLPTSIPLSLIFYALFAATMGRTVGEPFFAGFVVGYLFYDGTHYYVHHFVPRARWGKFLRRHHLTHHHADHDGGFGVSTPLWDAVFRTMPAKRK
jgi:sterol desaturase/sphingolipid hydroxylase (fatty acid hydroxylase superfamily)